MAMKRRALSLLVLGAALVARPSFDYVREFLAVDSCLDAGGSFDYTQSRCDHVDNHPFVAYSDRHATALRIGFAGAIILCVGAAMLSIRSAPTPL
jgi:hypothetical protein